MVNTRQKAAQRIRKSPPRDLKRENYVLNQVNTFLPQPNRTNFNPSQTNTLERLQTICSDTFDPISMDDFNDLSSNELNKVVAIGSGKKKHCYLLDNIMNHVQTNIEKKYSPKDPLNPSHVLTEQELNTIYSLKEQSDPNFKRPKPKEKTQETNPLDLDLFRQLEVNVDQQRQLLNQYEQRQEVRLPVLRNIHQINQPPQPQQQPFRFINNETPVRQQEQKPKLRMNNINPLAQPFRFIGDTNQEYEKMNQANPDPTVTIPPRQKLSMMSRQETQHIPTFLPSSIQNFMGIVQPNPIMKESYQQPSKTVSVPFIRHTIQPSLYHNINIKKEKYSYKNLIIIGIICLTFFLFYYFKK